jgi:hypothetical protein
MMLTAGIISVVIITPNALTQLVAQKNVADATLEAVDILRNPDQDVIKRYLAPVI